MNKIIAFLGTVALLLGVFVSGIYLAQRLTKSEQASVPQAVAPSVTVNNIDIEQPKQENKPVEQANSKTQTKEEDDNKKKEQANKYYEQGNKLYSENDIETHRKALENYNKAVELEPNNVDYLKAAGRTYSSIRSYEESTKLYKKVLELKPEDIDSYGMLALNYDSLGNYEEALKMYDKLIKIEPNVWSHYMSKGFILSRLERYGEGVLNLKKARSIDLKSFSDIVKLRLQRTMLDAAMSKKLITPGKAVEFVMFTDFILDLEDNDAKNIGFQIIKNPTSQLPDYKVRVYNTLDPDPVNGYIFYVNALDGTVSSVN